jgi:hypothetical protein
MTSTDTKRAGFSPVETDSLTEYHPLNRPAIAALVLGVLSATALAHQLFWVVPIITIVVAVVALRQISASSSEQRGRMLALVGLACALVFGSWAMTRSISRQMQISEQAQACCDEWFELIRTGRLYEAHQLTLPYDSRLSDVDPLEEIYEDRELAEKVKRETRELNIELENPPFDEETVERSRLPEQFDDFMEDEPMKTIRAAGKELRYRCEELTKEVRLSRTEAEFGLRYTVMVPENGKTRSLPVMIVVQRHLRGEGNVFWHVLRVMDPEEAY